MKCFMIWGLDKTNMIGEWSLIFSNRRLNIIEVDCYYNIIM